MPDAAIRFRHKIEGIVSDCSACVVAIKEKQPPGKELAIEDKLLRGEVRRRLLRAQAAVSEAVDMLRTGAVPSPIAEAGADDGAKVASNASAPVTGMPVDVAALVRAEVAKALRAQEPAEVEEPQGESPAARAIAEEGVEPLGAAVVEVGSTSDDIPLSPKAERIEE